METNCFKDENTLFHSQKQNVLNSESHMKLSHLSIGDDAGTSRSNVRNNRIWLKHK